MNTQRITIRLPQHVIHSMDLFVRVGEFATRSEVIRHAVRDYLRKRTSEILESADQMKQVQQLQQELKSIESYLKK